MTSPVSDTAPSQRRFGNFGVFSLLMLLAIASTYVAVYSDMPTENASELVGTASVFDFLPAELQSSAVFHQVLRWTFFVSAACWAACFLRRFAGVACALSFVMLFGLKWEHSHQMSHNTHLAAQLLILYALWMFTIKAHPRLLWRGDRVPFPHWMHQACIFVISLFFFYAGVSKFLTSGFAWADGVSLQSWVHQWGHDNFARDLVLSDIRLAQFGQTVSMFIELSAPLALLGRWPRIVIGCLLAMLIVGIMVTFGWFPSHFAYLMVYYVFANVVDPSIRDF